MSQWIAQHFLHPSYVLPWGVALAAIPILIHLINRLRYRRVRFAAMNFLLRSQQRNRRRLLIEQILLLLLRIAIVAGLLILISRMVLDPSALWAFRGAKSHHVILLDDSGSMRDRWGETSAFREGLTVVRRFIAEGARRPGTQQCTLLLLSQPERPLFLKRDVNTTLAAELETTFERLECTHRGLDLESGVLAAAKLLKQDAGTVRHLHVVSDFRVSDWGDRPAMHNAFLAVAKTGASIDLSRTVAESHENLGITELKGDVHTAAAGVPVRLYATLSNFGNKVAQHVRLSVIADGELLPRSYDIVRFEAGQNVEREIDVTFKKPGKHTVEVQLPADSLAADNRRFAAIDVTIANPVLIIDGNPESTDGSYISMALAPDESTTGFSTRTETPDFLSREPLEPFRCIYLLNVPQLRADTVRILSDYVRHGGGIAWFLGDVVKTAFYNDELHKADGLFPVTLADKAKQAVRLDGASLAPELSFADHPIFRHFQDQSSSYVSQVRINTWIPVADDWVRDDNQRRDDVKTIMFLNTKEPIGFERRLGSGHILAFLTTAGPKWNDWCRNPSVVLFHLELAKYMSREDHALERRTVGEPIEVAFNPAEFLDTVEIIAPDTAGKRGTLLKAARPTVTESADSAAQKSGTSQNSGTAQSSGTAQNSGTANNSGIAQKSGRESTPTKTRAASASSRNSGESVRVSATYTETDRPGLYIVRLFKDLAAAPQERWVAYNVPPSESDLKTATTPEILARLADVHVQIHEPGAFNWLEGHSAAQEARTLWLALLAAALVAEQLFAHRLSYLPKTTGRAA